MPPLYPSPSVKIERKNLFILGEGDSLTNDREERKGRGRGKEEREAYFIYVLLFLLPAP